MTDNTLFVGLDVHKQTIAVALVEAAAGTEVRFYGTLPNTPDAIRGLYKKLSKNGQQLHIATKPAHVAMGCDDSRACSATGATVLHRR